MSLPSLPTLPSAGGAAPLAPPPAGPEVELAVSGMHCASCVGRIESALGKVPGVSLAVVDLLSGRARVRLADPALPLERLGALSGGAPGLAGRLTGTLEGSGTLEEPRLSLAGRVDGAAIGGQTLGRAGAEAGHARHGGGRS